MKRFLGFSVAMFCALVAIALVGGDAGAVAGHGCHGARAGGGLLSKIKLPKRCHGGGGLLSKLHAKRCHGKAAAAAPAACDTGACGGEVVSGGCDSGACGGEVVSGGCASGACGGEVVEGGCASGACGGEAVISEGVPHDGVPTEAPPAPKT